MTAHIDKTPQEVLNLPDLTRVWDEIGQKPIEMGKSKFEVDTALLALKIFVKSYFDEFNGSLRIYKKDHTNELMFEMLQIVEMTIKLGFYQTEAELRDICMVVI